MTAREGGAIQAVPLAAEVVKDRERLRSVLRAVARPRHYRQDAPATAS